MGLISKSDTDKMAPSKDLEDELTRMFNSVASSKRPKLTNQPEIDTKRYLGVVDKKLTDEEEELR
jgi:Ca2+-binding EF-hand superfamily protein